MIRLLNILLLFSSVYCQLNQRFNSFQRSPTNFRYGRTGAVRPPRPHHQIQSPRPTGKVSGKSPGNYGIRKMTVPAAFQPFFNRNRPLIQRSTTTIDIDTPKEEMSVAQRPKSTTTMPRFQGFRSALGIPQPSKIRGYDTRSLARPPFFRQPAQAQAKRPIFSSKIQRSGNNPFLRRPQLTILEETPQNLESPKMRSGEVSPIDDATQETEQNNNSNDSEMSSDMKTTLWSNSFNNLRSIMKAPSPVFNPNRRFSLLNTIFDDKRLYGWREVPSAANNWRPEFIREKEAKYGYPWPGDA